jgi:RimJ/RimL family protein N-acetyltransferase
MHPFPSLSTKRLFLRQFRPDDAAEVQRLAGAKEVAMGTLIPHPYPEGMAIQWIESQREDFQAGELVNFAIDLSPDNVLIGSIGLTLNTNHCIGELGYWIGVPYWGHGYATEAARAVLGLAFGKLGLRKVFANHSGNNPASGQVLRKAGMLHEGSQKGHFLRDGKPQDLELYGLLREDSSYKKPGL